MPRFLRRPARSIKVNHRAPHLHNLRKSPSKRKSIVLKPQLSPIVIKAPIRKKSPYRSSNTNMDQASIESDLFGIGAWTYDQFSKDKGSKKVKKGGDGSKKRPKKEDSLEGTKKSKTQSRRWVCQTHNSA
ncbi:hypothetical protein O1611_g6870 [Lasiodiplodia mahajangana]|uniref:Uncharacterized protein n=1 Tax=Lasiodiplodia mahajangana TaxID=1108764 RepID=A0ACC2JHB6_9PEZI|nr:hypothetical protein O1611_g6870 [Lasiodiplodia mahajangana]